MPSTRQTRLKRGKKTVLSDCIRTAPLTERLRRSRSCLCRVVSGEPRGVMSPGFRTHSRLRKMGQASRVLASVCF